MDLNIPEDLVIQIISLAETGYPNEVCGFLGGRGDCVLSIFPIENILRSSVQFQMEPYGQYLTHTSIDKANQELLVIYHSHPFGPEALSEKDMADFNYPGVISLLVYRIANIWRLQAFEIRSGMVEPVKLIYNHISQR